MIHFLDTLGRVIQKSFEFSKKYFSFVLIMYLFVSSQRYKYSKKKDIDKLSEETNLNGSVLDNNFLFVEDDGDDIFITLSSADYAQKIKLECSYLPKNINTCEKEARMYLLKKLNQTLSQNRDSFNIKNDQVYVDKKSICSIVSNELNISNLTNKISESEWCLIVRVIQ